MAPKDTHNGGPTGERQSKPVLPFGRTTRTKRSMMRADQNPEELSTPLLAQAFAEMAKAGYIVRDEDEF